MPILNEKHFVGINDADYLKDLETAISNGEHITPINYVRKYDEMTSPDAAEKYNCIGYTITILRRYL